MWFHGFVFTADCFTVQRDRMFTNPKAFAELNECHPCDEIDMFAPIPMNGIMKMARLLLTGTSCVLFFVSVTVYAADPVRVLVWN